MTDPEKVKKYAEHANAKQIAKGGQTQGKNSLAQEILAQDQYKQEILDGLLQIRRQKELMQDDDGNPYIQEFIKLEDGSGEWRRPSEIPDEKLKEIMDNGMVNREGASEIITHLQAVSNNNIALSNLTKDQINDIGRTSTLSIDSKIRNNKERYGIDSTDDVEQIIFGFIVPNVQASLNKAKNGSLVGELLRETKLVGSLDDEDEGGEDGGWKSKFS